MRCTGVKENYIPNYLRLSCMVCCTFLGYQRFPASFHEALVRREDTGEEYAYILCSLAASSVVSPSLPFLCDLSEGKEDTTPILRKIHKENAGHVSGGQLYLLATNLWPLPSSERATCWCSFFLKLFLVKEGRGSWRENRHGFRVPQLSGGDRTA